MKILHDKIESVKVIIELPVKSQFAPYEKGGVYSTKEGKWITYTDKEYYQSQCQELIKKIERHIDCDGDIYQEIKTSKIYTCSFCGLDFDEGKDGCPLCCTEAIKEWELKNNGNIHERSREC